MNKVMAILLLLGALGAFGLSQRASYQVQDQSKYGAPVSKPRVVSVGPGDRAFFIVLGAACMAGCLYCVAKLRRADTHD